MTASQLKRLRKNLPSHYGKAIADKLGIPTIDNIKVVKVLNGEITDPNILIPVLDAAAELIESRKRVGKKLTKALNPS